MSHTRIYVSSARFSVFFLQIILISFGIRERSSTAHEMHQNQEGYDRNVFSLRFSRRYRPSFRFPLEA